MLLTAALLPWITVSAQSFTSFTKYAGQEEAFPNKIPGAHRTRPAVGDFNNDGFIDLYYGGQDPAAETGWSCLSNLVRNNGDGTFTAIGTEESGLPINSKSNFLFFDYNNDGNLDLLLTGDSEYDLPVPRYTYLYKNLGESAGYKFEQVLESGIHDSGTPTEDYGKAFAAGDYDKDGYIDFLATYEIPQQEGMGYNDTRYSALYRNNGDGTFTKQEGIARYSSGAVAFTDFDNDGWLDILISGYSGEGRTDDESKRQSLSLYKNNQDGTFTEATPDNILNYGNFDSETVVADLNSDGLMDIIAIGYAFIPNYERYAYFLINNGNFTFSPMEAPGFEGGRTTVIAADLNHDGLLDLAYSVQDKIYIYYQGDNYNFVPEAEASIPYIQSSSGGLNAGDFNNDNAIDIVVSGYNQSDARTYACPAEIYTNALGTEIEPNQPPSAPANVNAKIENNTLTVTWSASEDDHTFEEAITYNVYVKNNTTGEIFSLIPADPATGRLKTVSDIAVATHNTEYSMAIADGATEDDYTIGVQAIDQAYAASAFTVADFETGLNRTKVESFALLSVNDGIYVKGIDAILTVSDLSGRKIYEGITNTIIPITNRGIYLITVNGQTLKLVK